LVNVLIPVEFPEFPRESVRTPPPAVPTQSSDPSPLAADRMLLLPPSLNEVVVSIDPVASTRATTRLIEDGFVLASEPEVDVAA
jgi:hypothetical protein